jgi:hypothetical protein
MRVNHVIWIVVLLVTSSLFSSASGPLADGPPIIHQSANLKASDNTGNYFFGTSVAVRGDVIVVGAENFGASNQGAAYVFLKSGNSWEQAAELTASDGLADENVGSWVAISNDGKTIFAGAPALYATQTSGAVYVFVKPSGGWANMTETAKLTAAGSSYLGVYLSLSQDGSTLAAGAGGTAGYVFVEPKGGWANTTKPAATLTDTQGVAWHVPAISSDGSIIADGSVQSAIIKGATFVYLRPGSQWRGMLKPTAKLTPSDPNPPSGYSDEFGGAVATDGNIVAVGATNNNNFDGEAYIYVKPANGWSNTTETARIKPPESELVQPSYFFGFPVLVSGKTVFVGMEGAITDENNIEDLSGDVFAFTEPAGGWVSTDVENFSLLPTPLVKGDLGVFLFGNGVAIDGKTVVVGAPGTQYKIKCGILCRIGFPGLSYVFNLK